MKIVAVASVSFFENDITQVIVQMPDDATWKESYNEAIKKGLYSNVTDKDQTDWVNSLNDNFEMARNEMVEGEMDICITEFPLL